MNQGSKTGDGRFRLLKIGNQIGALCRLRLINIFTTDIVFKEITRYQDSIRCAKENTDWSEENMPELCQVDIFDRMFQGIYESHYNDFLYILEPVLIHLTHWSKFEKIEEIYDKLESKGLNKEFLFDKEFVIRLTKSVLQCYCEVCISANMPSTSMVFDHDVDHILGFIRKLNQSHGLLEIKTSPYDNFNLKLLDSENYLDELMNLSSILKEVDELEEDLFEFLFDQIRDSFMCNFDPSHHRDRLESLLKLSNVENREKKFKVFKELEPTITSIINGDSLKLFSPRLISLIVEKNFDFMYITFERDNQRDALDRKYEGFEDYKKRLKVIFTTRLSEIEKPRDPIGLCSLLSNRLKSVQNIYGNSIYNLGIQIGLKNGKYQWLIANDPSKNNMDRN